MAVNSVRLVPYEMVSPGFEAVYTGEKVTKAAERSEAPSPCVRFADDAGNVIQKWSTWTWVFSDRWPEEGKEWDDEEIRHINAMQTKLGLLSDEIRRIRAHISSLVPCDNGFPVTVDELLCAIGKERLGIPSFHNGCWMGTAWWESKSTQPNQAEAVQTILDILTGYLDGRSEAETIQCFPYAKGFVNRTYEWLGPARKLTRLQELLVERMLLPLEYFAGRNTDYDAVSRNCFEEGGQGARLDVEIAELGDLPKIHMKHLPKYHETLNAILDPRKKELYKVCCHIASGVHGLSDCHHNIFRYFERWIHGIGTGSLEIRTRKKGTERERLGRLLFGYLLGLDRWLLHVPMHFVLMDLGYVEMGFDPRNEILRVYSYLGGEKERTPTKEWLAACLWYNLSNNVHGGLSRHSELLQRAGQEGISVRRWMDSVLSNR